jgi:hypothetical protein
MPDLRRKTSGYGCDHCLEDIIGSLVMNLLLHGRIALLLLQRTYASLTGSLTLFAPRWHSPSDTTDSWCPAFTLHDAHLCSPPTRPHSAPTADSPTDSVVFCTQLSDLQPHECVLSPKLQSSATIKRFQTRAGGGGGGRAPTNMYSSSTSSHQHVRCIVDRSSLSELRSDKKQ